MSIGSGSSAANGKTFRVKFLKKAWRGSGPEKMGTNCLARLRIRCRRQLHCNRPQKVNAMLCNSFLTHRSFENPSLANSSKSIVQLVPFLLPSLTDRYVAMQRAKLTWRWMSSICCCRKARLRRQRIWSCHPMRCKLRMFRDRSRRQNSKSMLQSWHLAPNERSVHMVKIHVACDRDENFVVYLFYSVTATQ